MAMGLGRATHEEADWLMFFYTGVCVCVLLCMRKCIFRKVRKTKLGLKYYPARHRAIWSDIQAITEVQAGNSLLLCTLPSPHLSY